MSDLQQTVGTTQPQEPRPAAPQIEDDDADQNVSIFTEFVWFIRENKKWWLIPLVVIFLMLTVLIVLGSHASIAP